MSLMCRSFAVQPPGTYASMQTQCQPNEEKNNMTVSHCISRHTDQHMLPYYGGGDIKMIVLMKNNQSGSLGWNWFG